MLCVLGEGGRDSRGTENRRKQTAPWSVIRRAADSRKWRRERLAGQCECFRWSLPLPRSHLQDTTPSRRRPDTGERWEGSGKRVTVTAHTCLRPAVKAKRPPGVRVALRPSREKHVSKVRLPSRGSKSSQTVTAKSAERKFPQGTSSGHG